MSKVSIYIREDEVEKFNKVKDFLFANGFIKKKTDYAAIKYAIELLEKIVDFIDNDTYHKASKAASDGKILRTNEKGLVPIDDLVLFSLDIVMNRLARRASEGANKEGSG